MIINSNNFILYFEYQREDGVILSLPFCYANDITITINQEVLECAPNYQNNALWRNFYAGVKDYSLDIGGIVSVIDAYDFKKILVGVNSSVLSSNSVPISVGTILSPDNFMYNSLEDFILNSKLVNWRATDNENVVYNGQILMSNLTQTSSINDVNRFTGSFTGLGAINKSYLNPNI